MKKTIKAAPNKVDSDLAVTCFTLTENNHYVLCGTAGKPNSSSPCAAVAWPGRAEGAAGRSCSCACTKPIQKTILLHPIEADRDQKDVTWSDSIAKSIKDQMCSPHLTTELLHGALWLHLCCINVARLAAQYSEACNASLLKTPVVGKNTPCAK